MDKVEAATAGKADEMIIECSGSSKSSEGGHTGIREAKSGKALEENASKADVVERTTGEADGMDMEGSGGREAGSGKADKDNVTIKMDIKMYVSEGNVGETDETTAGEADEMTIEGSDNKQNGGGRSSIREAETGQAVKEDASKADKVEGTIGEADGIVMEGSSRREAGNRKADEDNATIKIGIKMYASEGIVGKTDKTTAGAADEMTTEGSDSKRNRGHSSVREAERGQAVKENVSKADKVGRTTREVDWMDMEGSGRREAGSGKADEDNATIKMDIDVDASEGIVGEMDETTAGEADEMTFEGSDSKQNGGHSSVREAERGQAVKENASNADKVEGTIGEWDGMGMEGGGRREAGSGKADKDNSMIKLDSSEGIVGETDEATSKDNGREPSGGQTSNSAAESGKGFEENGSGMDQFEATAGKADTTVIEGSEQPREGRAGSGETGRESAVEEKLGATVGQGAEGNASIFWQEGNEQPGGGQPGRRGIGGEKGDEDKGSEMDEVQGTAGELDSTTIQGSGMRPMEGGQTGRSRAGTERPFEDNSSKAGEVEAGAREADKMIVDGNFSEELSRGPTSRRGAGSEKVVEDNARETNKFEGTAGKGDTMSVEGSGWKLRGGEERVQPVKDNASNQSEVEPITDKADKMEMDIDGNGSERSAGQTRGGRENAVEDKAVEDTAPDTDKVEGMAAREMDKLAVEGRSQSSRGRQGDQRGSGREKAPEDKAIEDMAGNMDDLKAMTVRETDQLAIEETGQFSGGDKREPGRESGVVDDVTQMEKVNETAGKMDKMGETGKVCVTEDKMEKVHATADQMGKIGVDDNQGRPIVLIQYRRRGRREKACEDNANRETNKVKATVGKTDKIAFEGNDSKSSAQEQAGGREGASKKGDENNAFEMLERQGTTGGTNNGMIDKVEESGNKPMEGHTSRRKAESGETVEDNGSEMDKVEAKAGETNNIDNDGIGSKPSGRAQTGGSEAVYENASGMDTVQGAGEADETAIEGSGSKPRVGVQTGRKGAGSEKTVENDAIEMDKVAVASGEADKMDIDGSGSEPCRQQGGREGAGTGKVYEDNGSETDKVGATSCEADTMVVEGNEQPREEREGRGGTRRGKAVEDKAVMSGEAGKMDIDGSGSEPCRGQAGRKGGGRGNVYENNAIEVGKVIATAGEADETAIEGSDSKPRGGLVSRREAESGEAVEENASGAVKVEALKETTAEVDKMDMEGSGRRGIGSRKADENMAIKVDKLEGAVGKTNETTSKGNGSKQNGGGQTDSSTAESGKAAKDNGSGTDRVEVAAAEADMMIIEGNEQPREGQSGTGIAEHRKVVEDKAEATEGEADKVTTGGNNSNLSGGQTSRLGDGSKKGGEDSRREMEKVEGIAGNVDNATVEDSGTKPCGGQTGRRTGREKPAEENASKAYEFDEAEVAAGEAGKMDMHGSLSDEPSRGQTGRRGARSGKAFEDNSSKADKGERTVGEGDKMVVEGSEGKPRGGEQSRSRRAGRVKSVKDNASKPGQVESTATKVDKVKMDIDGSCSERSGGGQDSTMGAGGGSAVEDTAHEMNKVEAMTVREKDTLAIDGCGQLNEGQQDSRRGAGKEKAVKDKAVEDTACEMDKVEAATGRETDKLAIEGSCQSSGGRRYDKRGSGRAKAGEAGEDKARQMDKRTVEGDTCEADKILAGGSGQSGKGGGAGRAKVGRVLEGNAREAAEKGVNLECAGRKTDKITVDINGNSSRAGQSGRGGGAGRAKPGRALEDNMNAHEADEVLTVDRIGGKTDKIVVDVNGDSNGAGQAGRKGAAGKGEKAEGGKKRKRSLEENERDSDLVAAAGERKKHDKKKGSKKGKEGDSNVAVVKDYEHEMLRRGPCGGHSIPILENGLIWAAINGLFCRASLDDQARECIIREKFAMDMRMEVEKIPPRNVPWLNGAIIRCVGRVRNASITVGKTRSIVDCFVSKVLNDEKSYGVDLVLGRTWEDIVQMLSTSSTRPMTWRNIRDPVTGEEETFLLCGACYREPISWEVFERDREEMVIEFKKKRAKRAARDGSRGIWGMQMGYR